MKIVVPYEHNPADLSTIYLAVTARGARPGADAWKPAMRDTVDGRLVVWVRADSDEVGAVWLRDRHGERQAERL